MMRHRHFSGKVTHCFLLGSTLIWLFCPACAPVGDSPTLTLVNSALPDEPNVAELPGRAVVPADGLRQRIDAAIDQVQHRELQTSHGFWTVLHGILGVGTDLKLIDPKTRTAVTAIDYITGGGDLRGMRFIPTPAGLDVQMGPMFVGQGHVDQFVAEMLQVGLSTDHPFQVDGRYYTLMDFVRQAQTRVRVTENQELSWTVIVIGQCLGTQAQWTNSFDESLRLEDLVRYELDQNVEAAACGGTHRLFGLHWVHQLHVKNGGANTGVWQEVAEKMKRYQDLARELQNPDGSFSTEFFRGPGNVDEMRQRITSSGHVFEWLALSLPEEQLRANWVRRAANSLSNMILDIQSAPMEGGTLYHAAHGLRLYRDRCAD